MRTDETVKDVLYAFRLVEELGLNAMPWQNEVTQPPGVINEAAKIQEDLELALLEDARHVLQEMLEDLYEKSDDVDLKNKLKSALDNLKGAGPKGLSAAICAASAAVVAGGGSLAHASVAAVLRDAEQKVQESCGQLTAEVSENLKKYMTEEEKLKVLDYQKKLKEIESTKDYELWKQTQEEYLELLKKVAKEHGQEDDLKKIEAMEESIQKGAPQVALEGFVETTSAATVNASTKSGSDVGESGQFVASTGGKPARNRGGRGQSAS